MDRLLTQEEVNANQPWGNDLEAVIKAQDAKTHSEDMKAVGEWLEDFLEGVPLLVAMPAIGSFKRGEMPR